MSNIYDFCEYFYLLAKPLNKKEKMNPQLPQSPFRAWPPCSTSSTVCPKTIRGVSDFNVPESQKETGKERERKRDCENCGVGRWRGARNGSPKRRLWPRSRVWLICGLLIDFCCWKLEASIALLALSPLLSSPLSSLLSSLSLLAKCNICFTQRRQRQNMHSPRN